VSRIFPHIFPAKRRAFPSDPGGSDEAWAAEVGPKSLGISQVMGNESPPVNQQKAMENGHRNSELSHEKW